jgi:FMN phosphatase YigB (HAD superfamily)
LAGLAKRRDRVVHVGNDPVSDIEGAVSSGIDPVLIDREGDLEAPEVSATLPDLRGLPAFLRS